jgi:hypothetical protein
MIELHRANCSEESYSSSDVCSVARESLRVRLAAASINLGLGMTIDPSAVANLTVSPPGWQQRGVHKEEKDEF